MFLESDENRVEIVKDDFVKDEIILQAQKLFRQYGMKKTTMDEIALASGKAKSTLYHYFKSKDEVFDEVLSREHKSLSKVVIKEVKNQNTLKDKIQTYFITFHQETVLKINLYRILKQEVHAKFSNMNRFNNILKIETNFLSSLICEGIESGELSGIVKEQAQWFSELMVIAFLGVVKHSVTKDNIIDKNELIKVTNVIVNRLII